jgi:hypothetical protein
MARGLNDYLAEAGDGAAVAKVRSRSNTRGLDDYMEEASAPAVKAAPIPVVDPIATEQKSSTATTPAEARKEQIAANKAQLKSGMLEDAVDAAGYGVARGTTLGSVDRLVGIGTQAGESLASLVNPELSEDPNAGATARASYLRDEDRAKRNAPVAHFSGEVGGSLIPMIASSGAAAPAVLGTRTAGEALAAAAMSPAGRMAAQNFASGAMNERSDNPVDQLKSGITGAAVGAGVGKVAENTIGKAIEGASARELRGLTRDILRNSETDIAATATARKRFYERADSAIKEVKADKVMGAAIREGDAAAVANMARSKLQTISGPRAGMYNELDSVSMLGIDEIDAAIRRAEKTATGAKRNALESMRAELLSDWIENKWKNQGRLIPRMGKSIGVSNEGVREWLTDAQNASSRVIGGLEEGSRAEVKGLLEDVAHDVWQKHLDKVSRTNPDLVRSIREYDRRASGLMALESVMEQRARKDSEGILGFARKNESGIDKLVGAGAAAATAAGRPGEALAAGSGYLALKKAPAVASAINDKLLVPVEAAISRGPSTAQILQSKITDLGALANRGETWAVVADRAAQVGIPQSVARSIYERSPHNVARSIYERSKPVSPTGQDRRTSTRTR